MTLIFVASAVVNDAKLESNVTNLKCFSFEVGTFRFFSFAADFYICEETATWFLGFS